MKPGLAPAASAVLLGLGVAACRQVIGIETRSEGAPPVALGDACGACVESVCSASERACAEDPACAEAAACMAAAGLDDPAGRASCREQHFKGAVTSAFADLDACMRSDCQADCYGNSGFFAAYSSECQLCTEAACADWPSRCVADPVCEALAVQALGEGPEGHNPSSITALTAAAGADKEVERELAYCAISEACSLPCGFDGHDLACVSDYQWPRSLEPEANAEVLVRLVRQDFSDEPFPGATVDVCGAAGDACIPTDTAVADPQGLATVSLKLDGNFGFRGFFRTRAGTIQGEPTYPMQTFAYPVVGDRRGLAPTFRTELATSAIQLLAGGAIPGRAQVVVQFFDCSARQAADVSLQLAPSVLEGATIHDWGNGLYTVYNANPGCFDVVGVDPRGHETHRMRLIASPDIGTWAYVLPTSDPPALGYACTPSQE